MTDKVPVLPEKIGNLLREAIAVSVRFAQARTDRQLRAVDLLVHDRLRRAIAAALKRAEVEQAEKTVHAYVNRTVLWPNHSPGMILDKLVDKVRAEADALEMENG